MPGVWRTSGSGKDTKRSGKCHRRTAPAAYAATAATAKKIATSRIARNMAR